VLQHCLEQQQQQQQGGSLQIAGLACALLKALFYIMYSIIAGVIQHTRADAVAAAGAEAMLRVVRLALPLLQQLQRCGPLLPAASTRPPAAAGYTSRPSSVLCGEYIGAQARAGMLVSMLAVLAGCDDSDLPVDVQQQILDFV
jgi:hypothetical protein